MTVPLLVIAAVIIVVVSGSSGSSGSDNPKAVLTEPAPPQASAQKAACTKVIEKLPIDLGKLKGRVVHTEPTDSVFVVAWGDPAVVLSCGAARPKALHPGSSTQFFTAGPQSGPFYDRRKGEDGASTYTTVDRAAYVSIAVPGSYQGADVLPPLSRAIAAALPAVCAATPAAGVPTSRLCTRRP